MTQNPSPEPQAQDTPGTYTPATPTAPGGCGRHRKDKRHRHRFGHPGNRLSRG